MSQNRKRTSEADIASALQLLCDDANVVVGIGDPERNDLRDLVSDYFLTSDLESGDEESDRDRHRGSLNDLEGQPIPPVIEDLCGCELVVSQCIVYMNCLSLNS